MLNGLGVGSQLYRHTCTYNQSECACTQLVRRTCDIVSDYAHNMHVDTIY